MVDFDYAVQNAVELFYEPHEEEIVRILVDKLDQHAEDIAILNKFADTPNKLLSRLDQTKRSGATNRILKYYRVTDAGCMKSIYLTDIRINNIPYTKVGITYNIEDRFAADLKSTNFRFAYENVVESKPMHVVRASLIEEVILTLWKNHKLQRNAYYKFEGSSECAVFCPYSRSLATAAIDVCVPLMTCRNTGLNSPLHVLDDYAGKIISNASNNLSTRYK